jgi:hypothetical protein
MPGTCQNPDCPVATTQRCLLSHQTLAECRHYKADGAPVAADEPVQAVAPAKPPGSELPQRRSAARTFHAGVELGTSDAAEILRSRYGHVIAVLGSTDVGKTCFLCSLYLMATSGSLPTRYIFAGSRSLQAFEDRARGLRKWTDGKLAKQMVDHTILAEPRKPSLLHFGLREAEGDRKRIDLLLTDLPGEWTDDLVKRETAAQQFGFMPRADGVVMVVDGKLLLDNATRHTIVQDLTYFVDRLSNAVKVDKSIPIVLLISKSDEIGLAVPPAAQELAATIKGHGYRVKIISAAALSRDPENFKNGTGVLEAIEAIINDPAVSRQSTNHSSDNSGRSFGRFRG